MVIDGRQSAQTLRVIAIIHGGEKGMDTAEGMDFRNTVLVTGASWGLGFELSKQFAADGHDLVLVARNRDRLVEVAHELRGQFGIRVKIVAKNMATATAARELYDELKAQSFEIQVLVNNAGFGTYGQFSKTALETEEQEMQLNMVTPVQMSKLFVQDMLERRQGHIVNMASMAGYIPGPYMTIYFATKAFLLSFSEGLAEELRGSGVKVTAICPNVVATKFQETAQNQAAFIGGRFRPLMADATTTAKQAYREIKSGKIVGIPGFTNKLAVAFLRLVPRSLLRRAIVGFQKGPDIEPYPPATPPRS
ncbi:MAG: SDR family oxidoreductase [Pseudomonadota bacterium]|nr:SDR family oxidoreductase [Pseudomonadota bacterium]